MSTLENIYNLTPLESILINKIKPKGFKLELEENLNLSAPLSSNIPHKMNDNIVNNKCDLFLKKLLNLEISQEFYNKTAEPSFEAIERNIKNNKYKSIVECYNDVKKMLKYYVENYKNDERIYKLNEQTDKIFKSFEPTLPLNNIINDNIDKNYKIENAIPMTLNEKLNLGENIKKLDNNQLKGIIRIIQNNISRDKKEKYFEFDIDKLSPQKCRELENYVRSCLGDQFIEPQI